MIINKKKKNSTYYSRDFEHKQLMVGFLYFEICYFEEHLEKIKCKTIIAYLYN